MTESIDRTMVYRSIDGDRLEYARLRSSDAGGVADGTIIGVYGGQPLRVRHEYTCDSRWHVRNASVEVVTAQRDLLALSADEDGIWRRVDGGLLAVPLFDCFDVAIAITPLPLAFTVRRLALSLGEAAIVNVANIAIPSLEITPIEHRYTHLADTGGARRYRVENFDSGERSLVTIDGDGTVASYEGSFARVWPAVGP